MAEQESDRTEKATPHKLLEARNRGQAAKSADVASASVFTIAVAFIYWQGEQAVMAQAQLSRSLFSLAGKSEINMPVAMTLIRDAIVVMLGELGLFFAAIMLVAVIANLMQTGPVLSLHPLKPDMSRISPVSGMKRLLSGRTIFELARCALKLILLSFAVYHGLKSMYPHFLALSGISPLGYLQILLSDLASLGMKCALALVLIALLDLLYVRGEFARSMKMSRREVKEEVRQREGDPRVRARIRELQREMRRRSAALSKARSADVLITNPTHLAVALRYEHGTMAAPQLVAKGAGLLAMVLRFTASRHGIPIVQNRTLARALFHRVDFDGHVPAALYAEVARIIVWVFAMRQTRVAMPHGAAREDA